MLQIRTYSNPALASRAKEVAVDDDVTDLLTDMWEAMYSNKGIGLAANQVGVLKRVFVMHANGLKQEFINPVITKKYGGKVSSKEGCLSFPGMSVIAIRHRQIIIEGLDRNKKPVRRKLKGLAAFCAQHELDHLNGITIAKLETVQ